MTTGFRSAAIIVVMLTVAAAFMFGQTAQRNNATVGWISLFDGRSLAGWTPEQGARWHVAGGTIEGDAGGDGWLRSNREFADFDLRVDYRNAPKGNSGIFLRATRESNQADQSNPSGAYELQINNEDPTWATGSIENFIQRLVPVNPAANEWHSYEVQVQSDHLSATLDHARVLDGHDQKFKVGYIGLQHHRDNKIEFRNISIRPR
jgi:hypothetical protein